MLYILLVALMVASLIIRAKHKRVGNYLLIASVTLLIIFTIIIYQIERTSN